MSDPRLDPFSEEELAVYWAARAGEYRGRVEVAQKVVAGLLEETSPDYVLGDASRAVLLLVQSILVGE